MQFGVCIIHFIFWRSLYFLLVPVKEGWKGREEEEEDLSFSWMALRLREGTAI
jgi:hypothetical protein